MAIVFDEPPPTPLPLAVPLALPSENVTFVFSGACSTMSALVIPRPPRLKASAQMPGTSRLAFSSSFGSGASAETGVEVGSAVARVELEPESKASTDVVEPLKTTT